MKHLKLFNESITGSDKIISIQDIKDYFYDLIDLNYKIELGHIQYMSNGGDLTDVIEPGFFPYAGVRIYPDIDGETDDTIFQVDKTSDFKLISDIFNNYYDGIMTMTSQNKKLEILEQTFEFVDNYPSFSFKFHDIGYVPDKYPDKVLSRFFNRVFNYIKDGADSSFNIESEDVDVVALPDEKKLQLTFKDRRQMVLFIKYVEDDISDFEFDIEFKTNRSIYLEDIKNIKEERDKEIERKYNYPYRDPYDGRYNPGG